MHLQVWRRPENYPLYWFGQAMASAVQYRKWTRASLWRVTPCQAVCAALVGHLLCSRSPKPQLGDGKASQSHISQNNGFTKYFDRPSSLPLLNCSYLHEADSCLSQETKLKYNRHESICLTTTIGRVEPTIMWKWTVCYGMN